MKLQLKLILLLLLAVSCKTIERPEVVYSDGNTKINNDRKYNGCISLRMNAEENIEKLSKHDLDVFYGAIEECNTRYKTCLLKFEVIGFQRYKVLCGE